VTEDELASEPGAVATRLDDEPDPSATEPVFSPRDFRLNLKARLADPAEPLTDLDSPAIRKLTWEHVVPDRPASSTPSAATIVPLPPPSRVLPPSPPAALAALPFEPPPPAGAPAPVVERETVEPELIDAVDVDVVDEIDVAAEVDVAEVDVAEVEVDDEVDVAADEVEVDDEVDTDEVAPVAVVEPVAAPEVNRLALVPDLIDDDSPIELPQITPSGPIVAHPQSVYAPVLAESLYVPTPVRQASTSIAVMVADRKTTRRSQRKPKRHLFRSFVTLVLLFGLLAGGAFAAKKYLLRQPEWSVELKPLADDVAAARGLQFKAAVEVTALPIGDYAKRLAASAADVRADHAPAWRALGLLNGEFDLDSIGRQAMNDSPAFYDPTSKTIFVSDDLAAYQHLYRFAMHRALMSALLDQQFDWSTRLVTASPASALGLRAVIDGDALAVANSLSANDAPDELNPELLAFIQGHGSTLALAQYAANIVGRPGAVMQQSIASMVNGSATDSALEQATPTNDVSFDVARVEPATPSTAGTQGMMFWYYVLASRIDDGQAWSAAVHWTGDSLATSRGMASQCVDAKIAAADPESAAVLLAAFESWAATAPAESTTTVVPIDGNQVAIRACDPGAVLTAQVPPKVPVIFGGAGVERALVQAAVSAAGQAKVDPACLVTAARQRGSVLASPADDAPVFSAGWESPYVAANLDLALGCVVPSG
jgi:hypothetical protein